MLRFMSRSVLVTTMLNRLTSWTRGFVYQAESLRTTRLMKMTTGPRTRRCESIVNSLSISQLLVSRSRLMRRLRAWGGYMKSRSKICGLCTMPISSSVAESLMVLLTLSISCFTCIGFSFISRPIRRGASVTM